MSKLDEAIHILVCLGLPEKQQNERSALTLLALSGIGPKDDWKDTTQPMLRTVDIMDVMREVYGKDYKPNSRETIRRQTLHQFEQARLVDRNPDDPSRATNSGKTCYALSNEMAEVVRLFGTDDFDAKVADFLKEQGSLQLAYKKRRETAGVPLVLADGSTVILSAGEHNDLQVAIINEMGPIFAPKATVLYVGDTAKKNLIFEEKQLAKLKFGINQHDKLPDVVLYDKKRNWLFLIEAVTSHGPVSPKRFGELEEMLADCPADPIYITAFLTRAEFRKYAADIAWETEVWIQENPGHMIHFNGHKFLGPYKG